jgi:hypothetical protein
MIVAKISRTDGDTILLGLSRINVGRLMAGQPIHVRRAVHGEAVPDKLEIVVMFGETEAAIVAALKQQGLSDAAVRSNSKPM